MGQVVSFMSSCKLTRSFREEKGGTVEGLGLTLDKRVMSELTLSGRHSALPSLW